MASITSGPFTLIEVVNCNIYLLVCLDEKGGALLGEPSSSSAVSASWSALSSTLTRWNSCLEPDQLLKPCNYRLLALRSTPGYPWSVSLAAGLKPISVTDLDSAGVLSPRHL